jgi:ABC-type phosphate transport system substrate-binding protein
VTHSKPNGNTLNFIKWVLTKGQDYVDDAGFIKLPKEQLSNELKKF